MVEKQNILLPLKRKTSKNRFSFFKKKTIKTSEEKTEEKNKEKTKRKSKEKFSVRPKDTTIETIETIVKKEAKEITSSPTPAQKVTLAVESKLDDSADTITAVKTETSVHSKTIDSKPTKEISAIQDTSLKSEDVNAETDKIYAPNTNKIMSNDVTDNRIADNEITDNFNGNITPESNLKRWFKKSDRTFSLLPPGFRTKKKSNMIIASVIYILAILVSLPDNYFLFVAISVSFFAFNYFLDLLGYNTNKKHFAYTLIAFIVSLSIISASGGKVIKDEFYPEPDMAIGNSSETNTGSTGSVGPAPLDENDLPIITENHIKIAVDEISKETFVKDANIIVADGTVSFSILVELGTSDIEAKEVGEKFVLHLSSVVASSYTDMESPNNVGYGELFDDYNALITVGTSNEDILAKGLKWNTSLGFRWQTQ